MSATVFPPMPQLVREEEDTLETVNEIQINTTSRYKKQTNSYEKMSVVTQTVSDTRFINWSIDSTSLHIARLANKGDKRGVIEATVERGNYKFKLELCASGWRNSQDGYCAFYLTSTNKNNNRATTDSSTSADNHVEPFIARYRVQVGDITRLSSIRHDFHLGVGFPNFSEQTALQSFTQNGSIKFVITVEIFKCQSNIVPPNQPLRSQGFAENSKILTNMLKNMYEQKLHSDVTLVCQDGSRIPTQKCLLSAASPVFNAMFEHDLLENRLNEVRLSDFESSVIRSMVKFIYTATIDTKPMIPERANMNGDDDIDTIFDLDETDTNENISHLLNTNKNEAGHNMVDTIMSADTHDSMLSQNNVFQLFQFAEMYKMESMVISCCAKMYENLSVENVCELIIRANRYSHVKQTRDIQNGMWSFLVNHIFEVKHTSGYRELMTQHPELMAELVDKLAS